MNDPGAADVAVPCADPECLDAHGNRGAAEPETDGEHRYHECTTCGYAFGWRRTTPALSGGGVKSEGTCAVGVPEGLRRAMSAITPTVAGSAAGPPLMQITRRPPDAPTA